MKHVDGLLRSRVVRVFEAKLLHDPACLNFIGVEVEEFRNRGGLLRREQPLSQLYLAQMRLVHFSCGSDNSKRQFLAFS